MRAEAERFLNLAALQLIRQEGLSVVRSPQSAGDGTESASAWEEWDQVLVGEGAGVAPAIFAFRDGAQDDEATIRDLHESVVSRVAAGPAMRSQSSLVIRTVTIFSFPTVDPTLGRRLARIAPRHYHARVRPEVWVVDLGAGRLYAPRHFGLVTSRAQRTVVETLKQLNHDAPRLVHGDLARAEQVAQSQREAFLKAVRSNKPYVTYAVLLAVWIIFVLEAAYPSHSLSPSSFGSIPSDRTSLHFGAMQPKLVEKGEVWLLFTSMFVHFGFVHIFFNSIALYSVGSLVERIYGSLKYAFIYFVSGLMASLASFGYLALFGSGDELAGGASGAIFGIAGVVIVLGVRRRSIVPRAMAIQLSSFMGFLIVLNLLFDYFNPGIDIRAHLGGLVVGIILGYLLVPGNPSQEREPAATMAGSLL